MSKLDPLQRLDLLGLNPQNQAGPVVRVKLDEDESAFDWPAEQKARWVSQFQALPWNLYPAAHVDLRRAIAEPLGLSHEWVSLGAGAEEVIRHVFMAWCLRGTVVYPVPTDPLYGLVAQTLGIKHVAVLLRADFTLPLDQMIATAKLQGANVIIVGNPNNPTGNLFSRDELLTLVRETDALVVVDEAFIDYSGLTLTDVLSEYENLAIVRSFSHAWQSAIFRVGYLLAHPRVVMELEKVRLPHNLNGAALLAGSMLLSRQSEKGHAMTALVKERESLRQALSGLNGVVSWPSAANFLLVGTTQDSVKLAERLLAKGILVRSFERSPLMNCIRVTVGHPEANAAFLSAMTELFGPVK